MKYLVLLHRADDDLNPDTYWTDNFTDAHDVGESSEYHSYTLIETAKVASYVNED